MWAIVAFAFLGGLILNLMPCVLPVLAIKLAAIIDSSGQSRGLVRMRFVAGAMGILASFGIGALGLAALRFGGGQIGWGIQYQKPSFPDDDDVCTGIVYPKYARSFLSACTIIFVGAIISSSFGPIKPKRDCEPCVVEAVGW